MNKIKFITFLIGFFAKIMIFYSTLFAFDFNEAINSGKALAHEQLNYFKNNPDLIKFFSDNFTFYDNSTDNKSFVKAITNLDKIDTSNIENLYGDEDNFAQYVYNLSSDNYTPQDNSSNIYANQEFKAYDLVKNAFRPPKSYYNDKFNLLEHSSTNEIYEGNFAYGTFSLGNSFEDCNKETKVNLFLRTGHLPDYVTCEKINSGEFVCKTIRKYNIMISNHTEDTVNIDGITWYKKCQVTNHSYYYYSESIDNQSCQNIVNTLNNEDLLNNCHIVSKECIETFPVTIKGEEGTKIVNADCGHDTETSDHQCKIQWNDPVQEVGCYETIHDSTWEECEASCQQDSNVLSTALEYALDYVTEAHFYQWTSGKINSSDYGCASAEEYRQMQVQYTFQNPDCTIEEGIADLGYNKKCIVEKTVILCDYMGGSNPQPAPQYQGNIDTCEEYEDNSSCVFVNRECLVDDNGNEMIDNNTGECIEWNYIYDCGKEISYKEATVEQSLNCVGNIRCMGTECTDAVQDDLTIDQLADVESDLKYVDKAVQSLDSETSHVFVGKQMECTKAGMFRINCCKRAVAKTSIGDALDYIKLGVNAYKAAKYSGLIDKFLANNAGQVFNDLFSRLHFWNPLNFTGDYNTIAFYKIGEFAKDLIGEDLASYIFNYDEYGIAYSLSPAMSALFNVVGFAYSSYQVFMTLGQIFFHCTEDDVKTVSMKNMGFCHYVGTYCKVKVLGKCLQKAEFYCCYNNFFDLWFNEQVRSTPQPEIQQTEPSVLKWKAGAKTGNCNGFSPEILDKVDTSNFNSKQLALKLIASQKDYLEKYGAEKYDNLTKDFFEGYITKDFDNATTGSYIDTVRDKVAKRVVEKYDNGTNRIKENFENYINTTIDNITDLNLLNVNLGDKNQGDNLTTPKGVGHENNNLIDYQNVKVKNVDH